MDQESFEQFDTIIIDDLLQEASLPEKLVNIEWVDGDLSQLVLDKCPRRSGDQQRNAFVFRGHALGDLALSGLAYEKHLAQNG